ncbi:MAG: maleylpyruvate isomerase family mycothiol-dependent enzyme [Actinomycetota bacterium]|nr:maleylpyruvate isomerase family mycothiol-dependent enzyme [Actinomycetota bacterium]
MSLLDAIGHERLVLADLLDTLTPAQLQTPSFCGDWTVQQVAGHLLMPLVTPLRAFALEALKARGNFDTANDRASRRFAQRSISEISAGLRANARNRFHAPTFGLEAPLAEMLLHGQDIRRPLGLTWGFPLTSIPTVLDLLASPKAARGFVPRGIIRGLRFEAVDVDWAVGDGALVRGPGSSLAYAMTGRKVSLDELSGAGVAALRER